MVPVVIILSLAFKYCSQLTSVQLCEGLEKIGMGAFHVCTNLCAILIPLSIKVIDKDALNSCMHLKTVKLHGRLQRLDIWVNLLVHVTSWTNDSPIRQGIDSISMVYLIIPSVLFFHQLVTWEPNVTTLASDSKDKLDFYFGSGYKTTNGED